MPKFEDEFDKLIVIDGNHLVHRAFYAIQSPLTTSFGEPTNALYGFSSMLMNILEQEQPDYVAMTFDEKAPTFRHEAHEGYKATRTKAPDELYIQIPRIKEMLRSLSIQSYSVPGFEADDIMGTLATKAALDGIKTYIVTGDMDMLQLVNEDICVVFPHKGYKEPFFYYSEEVYKKYGIYPNQVVDYKALVGDSSDNIKGVTGIGPKSASKLLSQYKNLDLIYEHISELPKKLQEKLLNDREQAYFARSLATIITDVSCEFRKDLLAVEKMDYLSFLNFCEKMEMRSLVGRLKKTIPADRLAPKSQMTLF